VSPNWMPGRTEGRGGYRIHLPVFEGPLDLLLHLIEREEIDIYDIPVAHITEQYLDYLDAIAELDLKVTSEFLVMAAELLSLKARMLLPPPPSAVEDSGEDEDGGDPRDELVRRLLEYRRYRETAARLQDMESEARLTLPRLGPAVPADEDVGDWVPVRGVDVGDLVGALRSVLAELSPAQVAEISRDRFTVFRKMAAIMSRLRERPRLRFSDLCREMPTVEVVVTLLALLELLRLGRVAVQQRRLFGQILITPARPGVGDEPPVKEGDR